MLRLLGSIGDFAFTQSDKALYVHHYMTCQAETAFGPVHMETKYPYDGRILLTLPAGAYDVGLRIPGWCREWKLEKNGEILSPENRDGYVRLAGSWAEGDQLRLTLEMPVRLVQAHPAVHEDCGRVAVTRGPLVYCMEECDNGKYLKDVRIRRNGTPSFAENPQLGVTEIRLPASGPGVAGGERAVRRNIPTRAGTARRSSFPIMPGPTGKREKCWSGRISTADFLKTRKARFW